VATYRVDQYGAISDSVQRVAVRRRGIPAGFGSPNDAGGPRRRANSIHCRRWCARRDLSDRNDAVLNRNRLISVCGLRGCPKFEALLSARNPRSPRHASVDTTLLYVHPERRNQVAQMAKFRRRG
jgi:hypothetical protein